MVEALRYKMGGSGFDSWWGWKFSSDLVPLTAFSSPWGLFSLYDYHGIALGVKMQSAHASDNSAILLVLNVSITAEAQYAVWHLSPRVLLWESCTFYW